MRTLRVAVTAFGIICASIGLAHLVVGPASIPGSIPVNATMDSEDRFYATLFLGFGIAVAWTGMDMKSRRSIFGALMAIFFAGGFARIISWIAVGQPDALFILLGALELLLPPLFWWWSGQTCIPEGAG